MLRADERPMLSDCPRCGYQGYERLKTHSHCVSCNFYEVPEDHSFERLSYELDKELQKRTVDTTTVDEIFRARPIEPKVGKNPKINGGNDDAA